MPLNIKDRATEQVVRELAALTHQTVTETVRRAAEEALRRARHGGNSEWLAAEIMEIGKRCAALPEIDTRSPDEILGYNEHGLPT